MCFSILKLCSSSYEKINNKSPSFQVNMKGLDWIPGAKSFYNYVGCFEKYVKKEKKKSFCAKIDKFLHKLMQMLLGS